MERLNVGIILLTFSLHLDRVTWKLGKTIFLNNTNKNFDSGGP